MIKLKTTGRIIFGLPFLSFGLGHLFQTGKMAGVLTDWPAANTLVIISGIALILGAVAIIINKKAKLAALGIALLMLIFIILLHIPAMKNTASDTMENMTAYVSFHKDLALLGAALFMAGVFHLDSKSK